MVTQRVHHLGDDDASLSVEVTPAFHETADGSEEIAARAVLRLARGLVPDHHRRGALVALEMLLLLHLPRCRLAAEGVEDMDARGRLLDGGEEPGEGAVDLLAEVESGEGVDHEGRVPHPTEAVVEIARGADHLGREVVGAAEMAPASRSESALIVRALRSTSSRIGPVVVHQLGPRPPPPLRVGEAAAHLGWLWQGDW